MPFLLAGVLLLWFVSFGLKGFVRANPAALARMLRRGGGFLAFGAAFVLLLRGRMDFALLLTGLGFWWLNADKFRIRGRFAPGPARRRSKVSRVRSAMIEMELDHATGVMAGAVLAGTDEGASLAGLSRERCLALYQRCLADDPEGARLLEAYLDRRFAGWRQAGHHRSDAGRTGPAYRGGWRPGTMSEDEAHEILGLSKSATREEITRAHRALMKKFHPDHGGSTDLAARVNEAKDVLMRRHP